jgi:hypothetical protein
LPERAVSLCRDLVGATKVVEVIDENRSEINFKRLEHLVGGNGEHLGLHAVDIGVELGSPRVEQREDSDQAWRLVGSRHQILRRGLERRQPAPTLVLHHHLEAAGIADTAHRRRWNDDGECLFDRAQARTQIGQYPIGGKTLGDALRERSQGGKDGARVRRVGESSAVQAGERHGMHNTRSLQEDLGGTADHRVRALQRCAGRKLIHGDEIALVLGRDEAGRRALELPAGERDKAPIHNEA